MVAWPDSPPRSPARSKATTPRPLPGDRQLAPAPGSRAGSMVRMPVTMMPVADAGAASAASRPAAHRGHGVVRAQPLRRCEQGAEPHLERTTRRRRRSPRPARGPRARGSPPSAAPPWCAGSTRGTRACRSRARPGSSARARRRRCRACPGPASGPSSMKVPRRSEPSRCTCRSVLGRARSTLVGRWRCRAAGRWAGSRRFSRCPSPCRRSAAGFVFFAGGVRGSCASRSIWASVVVAQVDLFGVDGRAPDTAPAPARSSPRRPRAGPAGSPAGCPTRSCARAGGCAPGRSRAGTPGR